LSRLARLSLAHRALVALAAVIATAFGFIAIPSLKQQLFPSLDFPAAFIVAPYPAAPPELVESLVTEPIENAVGGVGGLEGIRSTSREGMATLQLEFAFGTDLDAAVSRIESAIGRAQLPVGVEPQVIAGRTDDFPVIILAASSSSDPFEFADRVRRVVVPEIQSIDGVREATVTGAQEQIVAITPRPAALAAGVDLAAIAATLQANGTAVPAGSLTDAGRSLTVAVGTPIGDVAEIADLYLPAAEPDADPIRLGDVATVALEPAEVTSITRTNGRPSLGIAVTATPDGDAVGISRAVKERLPALAAALGGDAALTPVFDQAPFVEQSIQGLTHEGLLGLVMAVLVILVFLLSVRSTLVTAVSIPLSVVVALIGLWLGDHSLNVLTLGGLTIAIGRVVDDSIVVLENIKRHLSYGEDRREAILTAVKEVAGAVTASTLTTVAVFAPIALVGGLVGQLFSPFALTVTVALAASLLVSLTVIPVLAYWFLRPAGGGASAEEIRRAALERELRNPLQRSYLPVVRFAITRRWLTLGLGVAVFIGTVALGGLLQTNFFDQSGEKTLTITQRLPEGTSLAATDEAARQVEAILADTDGVATYQVTSGTGGGLFGLGGAGTNVATFSVTVADEASVLDLAQSLRESLTRVPGTIKVDPGSGGGFSATAIQVIVQADDPQTLRTAAEQVHDAVAQAPDIVDVTSDLATSAPRVQVTVDRFAASRLGLTEAAIGQAVAVAMRGSPLAEVTIDGVPHPVVLRLGTSLTTAAQLRSLPLPTPSGALVPLEQVADVSEVDGPVQVSRIDGARSVTISGTATGRDIGATTAALRERLAALNLPAGASWTLAGVSADQAEAFGDLGIALLAAVAIVFLVMAATFRSLVQPLILLVSVPFAATGAIGLLLLTGTPLGVPALIGMLMLVGIVVTNAIVLMDLINQYRSQGMDIEQAVIEGGRRRLRPILMTAIATIFALLPMALGVTGSGGFISQPLAIVVIGGLVSSTALTLVLVPALYTMVERTKQRFGAAPAYARVEQSAPHQATGTMHAVGSG